MFIHFYHRLSPPVLPLCSLKEIHLSTDKFFRMEPSEITNGCFLSILTREVRGNKNPSPLSYFGTEKQQSLLKGTQECHGHFEVACLYFANNEKAGKRLLCGTDASSLRFLELLYLHFSKQLVNT
jgi:hypothetical protein